MLIDKKRKKRMINLLFLSFVFNLLVVTISTNFYFVPVFGQKQTEAEQGQENQTKETEQVQSPSFDLSSPSAVLMEGSTGTVIYEKDADTRRSPASITKIMTLLLIFDELKSGKISLDDQVTTSAHAKSMGGSQVFLEEGEVQTVETLIKCIVIASGNDASVAMAEYIAGSEEEFVARMNQKAESLGMKNTHFLDCCGLTDDENHFTSARDVAIMSRALIVLYPEIYNYTKIWMEDIVHTTQKGSSNFTLSSTNKLLKQYEYATGLKTGSTSAAKYCFSGTARKNGIDLIAVVMACPQPKERFVEAKKLLEYGFSIAAVYEDENDESLEPLKVLDGKEECVEIEFKEPFSYLDLNGNDLSKMEKKLELVDAIIAPVGKGQSVGRAVYKMNEKEIGSIDIITKEEVQKATFLDRFEKVYQKMLL